MSIAHLRVPVKIKKYQGVNTLHLYSLGILARWKHHNVRTKGTGRLSSKTQLFGEGEGENCAEMNWVAFLIRTSSDSDTEASHASLLLIVITVLEKSLRPCTVSSEPYPKSHTLSSPHWGKKKKKVTKMKATDRGSKQRELCWVAVKTWRSCFFTSVLLIICSATI